MHMYAFLIKHVHIYVFFSEIYAYLCILVKFVHIYVFYARCLSFSNIFEQ